MTDYGLGLSHGECKKRSFMPLKIEKDLLMKKCLSTLPIVLLLLIAGGCAAPKKAEPAAKPSQSVKQEQKTSKSSEEKKETEADLFDKLPLKEKIYVYASFVDKRIGTYKTLEQLTLSYAVENDSIYLYLTSGAGSGHPIYLVKSSDLGITPEKAVVYQGIDGYKLLGVDRTTISKAQLYGAYEKYKSDIGTAVNQINASPELANTFREQESLVKPETPATSSVDKTSAQQTVSQDDILSYFKNYIMADLNVLTGHEQMDNASWQVDENNQPIIRYSPAGRGASVKVEGNRIIYECFNYGGVSENGTVAKSRDKTAYYNIETGEHGLM